MKLIDRIKTILYTLMFVTIVGAGFGVYHLYEDSKANAIEIETQEVVEALEEIIKVTKPDF